MAYYERDARAQISRWERNVYESGIKEGRKAGMREGREIGREEGREEGRHAALTKMIRSMAHKGKTADEIAEMTDIPCDEIRRILTAQQNEA